MMRGDNDCRWCAMPLEIGRSGYCDECEPKFAPAPAAALPPQRHAPMSFRVRVIRHDRLVYETPCRTLPIARILARRAINEQPAGAAVEITRGGAVLEIRR